MKDEIDAYLKKYQEQFPNADLSKMRELMYDTWTLYVEIYKNNLQLGINRFRKNNLPPIEGVIQEAKTQLKIVK